MALKMESEALDAIEDNLKRLCREGSGKFCRVIGKRRQAALGPFAQRFPLDTAGYLLDFKGILGRSPPGRHVRSAKRRGAIQEVPFGRP